MSEEGPKLYSHKPKKAQIKQFQESSSATTATSGAAASYKMGLPPPPPPQPPKESFARRYRFLVPLLLAVNFGVGAYLFLRTKKKDIDPEEEAPKTVPSAPVSTPTITASVAEQIITPEPVKQREPISENEQRELYKWVLEEKRKIKPKDPEEKKRIDEEKAILKQFIRAKSIPSI